MSAPTSDLDRMDQMITKLSGLARLLLWVLAAFIESKRGQSLTVYDAFPQLFKDLSKTQAEMIAAGWLPNPEVTP